MKTEPFGFGAPCLNSNCAHFNEPMTQSGWTRTDIKQQLEQQNEIKMYCVYCDSTRAATDEERENLKRELGSSI